MNAPVPQLTDLFDRALEVPAAERGPWLDAACAGDTGLRRRLEELLAADSGPLAQAFDASTAGAALPRPGELVLGRYRIVREVGRGGMGVVFLAEQQEPRRRVAIKCLLRSFDPEGELRFRREAELLGRLEHPSIARLIEVGPAAGGRPPLLVLEYVDGVPLREHCRDLPVPAVLELFAAIADAVAHAHERGVVHRDLKPQNVLVERHGDAALPRVLDFGIARPLGDDPHTAYTRPHQILGTLAYLSPEQVAHGSAAVSARSDVWSLGMTLYEMLAGRLALPITGASLAEAARVLRDEEPAPLGQSVPALRGDVATIVHKALQREPARRYADAKAVADDLRRCLRSEPIHARPSSVAYRLERFARRHRGLVAGLSLAFATLVAGLAVAVWLAGQARAESATAQKRTRELRALAREMLFEVDAELEKVAGTTRARQLLVQKGLAYVENLVRDSAGDPELLLEAARACRKLALVQGTEGVANLGDAPGALLSVERSLELSARALELAPDHAELLWSRLQALATRATLLRSLGREDERAAAVDAMQATARRLATAAPGPLAEEAAVMAHLDLARLHADRDESAEALREFATVAAFLERRLGRVDGDEDRRRLAMVHAGIGWQHACRREYDLALAAWGHAIEQGQRRFAADPLDADRAFFLLDAFQQRAGCHQRLDAPDEALADLARARELSAQLAGALGDDVRLQRLQCRIVGTFGRTLLRARRFAEAVPPLTDLVARADALAALPQAVPQAAGETIAARTDLGTALARCRRFAEAEAVLVAAVARAEAALQRHGERPEHQELLMLACGRLGEACANGALAATDAAAAAASAQRAIAALERQLTIAQQLKARGRLDPAHADLLTEVPRRIEQVRAR